MFQAAQTASTFDHARTSALLRLCWNPHDTDGARSAGIEAANHFGGHRDRIGDDLAMLRAQIGRYVAQGEQYERIGTAARQWPGLVASAEKYIARPLSWLIAARAGELSPRVRQLLCDAMWELEALGSFGDTLSVEDADDRAMFDLNLSEAGELIDVALGLLR